MKRLVIIYILSVFSFGVYAQYTESSYSAFSHRQYGGVYQTSSRSAHYGAEQSEGYHSSYHNAVNYQDRVSANTFSNTPSMDVDPIAPSSNDSYSGMRGTRMHSPVRPPQREIDNEDKEDEDLKEPETNDPNATPLGDTPWVLLALLVAGYAVRVGKKYGVRMPDARK